MVVTVLLFDETGAPLSGELRVELLHGGQVIAESRIDHEGKATFDVEQAAPFAVRLRASEPLVNAPSPGE